MQYITENQANVLATLYLEDPSQKFVVYNIRRRNYLLHDFYKFYYRFSRRESVWNTPLFNIEDVIDSTTAQENLGKAIYTQINQLVDDTLNLKLKKDFTLDDCAVLLSYYFNGKNYISFYDFYLGRVVLIKERDKSNDFGDLIGSRYQLIGNLHDIISHSIGLSTDFLETFMNALVNSDAPVRELPGFDELNNRLHDYLTNEIIAINQWVEKDRATEHIKD